MESLPVELGERILLFTDAQSLLKICRQDPSYLGLCNDATFWRQRFRQENLPLYGLEHDQAAFPDIYEKSGEVYSNILTLVNDLDSGQLKSLKILFADLSNLNLIAAPGVNPKNLKLYKSRADRLQPFASGLAALYQQMEGMNLGGTEVLLFGIDQVANPSLVLTKKKQNSTFYYRLEYFPDEPLIYTISREVLIGILFALNYEHIPLFGTENSP